MRAIPGGGTEVALRIERPRRRERMALDERPRPSVVIVDDHALFRAGVRSELEGLVDVLADAGTVEEAVAAILLEKPDVVLLDVHMPGGGGVEVIRKVGGGAPGAALPRPLGLRRRGGRDRVIRAGARGYVTKSISGPELAEAIAPRPRRRCGLLAATRRLRARRLHGEIPEARSIPSSTS